MATPESDIRETSKARLVKFFTQTVFRVQLFNCDTAIYQAELSEPSSVKNFVLDIDCNLDYILENQDRMLWLNQFFSLIEGYLNRALDTTDKEIFSIIRMKLKIACFKYEAESLSTQGSEYSERIKDLIIRARFLQLQLDKKTVRDDVKHDAKKVEPEVIVIPEDKSDVISERTKVIETQSKSSKEQEWRVVGGRQSARQQELELDRIRLQQPRKAKDKKDKKDKKEKKAAERAQERLLREAAARQVAEKPQPEVEEQEIREIPVAPAARAVRAARAAKPAPKKKPKQKKKTDAVVFVATVDSRLDVELATLLTDSTLSAAVSPVGSDKYLCFTTIISKLFELNILTKAALDYATDLHEKLVNNDDGDRYKIKTKKAKKLQELDSFEEYLNKIFQFFEYFDQEIGTVMSFDRYVVNGFRAYFLHIVSAFNTLVCYPGVELAVSLSKYTDLFSDIGKKTAEIMLKILARKDLQLLDISTLGVLCVYIVASRKEKIPHKSKELSVQIERLLKDLDADSDTLRQFSQFNTEEKALAICNFIYFYSGNRFVFAECRMIMLKLCRATDITQISNMAIWFQYIEALSLIFEREENLYILKQKSISRGKASIILDERPPVELAFDEPKVLLALVKHMHGFIDKNEELPPPFVGEVARYEKYLIAHIQHIFFCSSLGFARSLDVNLIIEFISIIKKLKQRNLYDRELSDNFSKVVCRLVASLVPFAALLKERIDDNKDELLLLSPVILLCMQGDVTNDKVGSLFNQKMILYVKLTLYFSYILKLSGILDIDQAQKKKRVTSFYEYMLAKDKVFELSLQDGFPILPDQKERDPAILAKDVEALQKDVSIDLSDDNIQKLRFILLEFILDKKSDKEQNINKIIARIIGIRDQLVEFSHRLKSGSQSESGLVGKPVTVMYSAGPAGSVGQESSETPVLTAVAATRSDL